MRVTILACGSRGDVQPYVALGRGLAAAGHAVRLATHAAFEPLVCENGLDFHAVDGDPHQILTSETGRDWLRAGRNPVRFVRGFVRSIEPLLYRAAWQSWEASKDAEAVVASLFGLYAGRHIAEKSDVPLVVAPYLPLHRTRAFASPLSPWQAPLGPLFNRSTHMLAEQAMWQPLRRSTNDLRRDLFGLGPLPFLGVSRELHGDRWSTIYGYSPAVLPRPPEWGRRIDVTGYWFLDRSADWTPPADLVAFLADGRPPVYVGFGSMHLQDPGETTRIVLRALSDTGHRGVMLTGPGGLGDADLPSSVFGIESVPHDWLFPQMSAVVHHGGAGTTAAALRAGVPSVVLPFFADQPFWGWRVSRLGVGPRPVSFWRLTTQRLADAIRRATVGVDIRSRAWTLGRTIRAESGVRRAVETLERSVVERTG